MPKESAGLLLCRERSGGLEVLLVHPGGPFFHKKDLGAWSIPKGEIAPDEDPLATAIREFEEELGTSPAGPYVRLTSIRQRGGKTVHAWASRGDLDVKRIRSGTFALEWPPKSGKMVEFPEVDRAEFFDLAEAAQKINASQRDLLDQVPAALASLGEQGPRESPEAAPWQTD